MTLTNMKIGLRLGLGFALILILLALVAGVGITRMALIEEHLDDIVNDNNVKTRLVNEMNESTHIVSRVIRTIILLTDQSQEAEQMKKIINAREKYNKAWEALQKFPASEKGKAIRAKIAEDMVAARALNQKVLDLASADKDKEATELLMKEAGPATTKWQDALDENLALQEENTKKAAEEASAAYNTARTLMFALTAIALALGVLIAWLSPVLSCSR